MATEIKKISEITSKTTFDGTEVVLMGTVNPLGNRKAALSDLKSYFKDSSLVIFDAMDDVEDPTIALFPLEEEDGAVLEIVFLTSKNRFVQRKTIGDNVLYSSVFNASTDYTAEDGVTPRTDRVFFSVADKELYIYDGSFCNIFDYIRIHAMTEEEFKNLTNPIEGVFYATYE